MSAFGGDGQWRRRASALGLLGRRRRSSTRLAGGSSVRATGRGGSENRIRCERRRDEKALDEALKNTFPASDPVSVEQPVST
jgi:hypothetical protein